MLIKSHGAGCGIELFSQVHDPLGSDGTSFPKVLPKAMASSELTTVFVCDGSPIILAASVKRDLLF
jgi:hypothetical protein